MMYRMKAYVLVEADDMNEAFAKIGEHLLAVARDEPSQALLPGSEIAFDEVEGDEDGDAAARN
jgi:hypothetical protein